MTLSPAPAQSAPSLDDLIAKMLSWKKETTKAKTPPKREAPSSVAPSKPAEPIAPGAWRHSSRWRSETLVVVVQTVVCDNCSARDTSSQPFIYVERYHPLYGRHLEALSPSMPRHGELPRSLREVESRVMYCRHCFLTSPCASAQPRLFPDSQCATFEVKGQLTLTDIFGTAQARTVEVTGTISPAGTSPDRGVLPAALPYFPLVIIQE
jgi:hypothetical protein